ncbi:hypothetical protein BOW53_11145 [Solemya pervernicosa gill symbiont]|uniref:DUF1585 domain-containing protein n=2 Tax=Gammaproteobacteria incertae sedis TaxID=118884 RepID=A0A1T2L352_9GAMM|nr:hypothetical protein [Candidatus Reidiella endopervernicosa]OOZ39537.1 hypothetical protein BOW53_11145 [Solemya pervernicosa gill symbiont]QKQ28241.1 hypothetical protein HUE57_11150 [Candidatus Reidiella endopervernicosa]
MVLFYGAVSAQAGPREQAKRLHDRIAGVPSSNGELDILADLIDGSQPGTVEDAAYRVMDHPDFYNVTLKNMVTPWTNEAQTPFAPLNDYTATVIGMVRDDVPFNTLLSADLLYVVDDAQGLPAYAMNSNAHYQSAENQGIDLQAHLVQRQQSLLTDLPAGATAGVITTRASAEAFFVAGTNRAMLRFTLMNHLCSDLEPLKDTTLSPDRIRQDVSRSPGGDSRIFLNSCIGCHTGMDPLAQAYAYYDYDSSAARLVYNDIGTIDAESGSRVQGKYLINADNFAPGFVTPDDRWDNYWRRGINSHLGWDGGLSGGGYGAKSMGQELGNSQAFASCQAKKVFRSVCLRDPVDSGDRNRVATMTSAFINDGYRFKRLFAEAGSYCMGD